MQIVKQAQALSSKKEVVSGYTVTIENDSYDAIYVYDGQDESGSAIKNT